MNKREKFVLMATVSLRLMSAILPSAQEQQDNASLALAVGYKYNTLC
jgi:hypothetical protein